MRSKFNFNFIAWQLFDVIFVAMMFIIDEWRRVRSLGPISYGPYAWFKKSNWTQMALRINLPKFGRSRSLSKLSSILFKFWSKIVKRFCSRRVRVLYLKILVGTGVVTLSKYRNWIYAFNRVIHNVWFVYFQFLSNHRNSVFWVFYYLRTVNTLVKYVVNGLESNADD